MSGDLSWVGGEGRAYVVTESAFSAVRGDTDGGMERRGTPSPSVSVNDDCKGLLSVNVPTNVWMSLIGASATQRELCQSIDGKKGM